MADEERPISPRRRHKRKFYVCGQIDQYTGRPCKVASTRAWNIKRHRADMHTGSGITFVPYDPNSRPRRRGVVSSIQPSAVGPDVDENRLSGQDRALPGPPVVASGVDEPQVVERPKSNDPSIEIATSRPVNLQSSAVVAPTSDSTHQDHSSSMPSVLLTTAIHHNKSGDSLATSLQPVTAIHHDKAGDSLAAVTPPTDPQKEPPVSVIQVPSSPTSDSDTSQSSDYVSARSTLSSQYPCSASEEDEEESPVKRARGFRLTGERKRRIDLVSPPLDGNPTKRSSADRPSQSKAASTTEDDALEVYPETGRVVAARLNDPIPSYEIKQSKQVPSQGRAVDWLTFHARLAFDETQERLLNAWGVSAAHRDTCVLLPEDWRASDPLTLLTHFDGHNYPSGASRAWYSYADHGTTLVRAASWFAAEQWPRRGVDLDAFLSCGPWKPMDASHLCHHHHCIIHVVYEPANLNHARSECVRHARFLRQEGRPVPQLCDRHDPPCLTQLACLTALETVYIQFHVLRQAKKLPPSPPRPRPRRYVYPTFESSLPSTTFPAVRVDPATLVSQAAVGQKPGRPELRCQYCDTIKVYASLVGFWSHLINKHEAVESQQRLEEIRRTASLWQEYWSYHSKGGKKSNPTQARLDLILKDNIGWKEIEAWDLQ